MRSEQVKLNSNSTMKTKLLKRIPTVVLCLVAVFPMTAITVRAADKKDAPRPAPRNTADAQAVGTATPRPALYQTTGSSPAQRKEWNAAEWKDPKWPDPGIILTNIVWDYVPVLEVANILRKEFKNHFEVVLPTTVIRPPSAIDPATGLPFTEPQPEMQDPTMIPIRLQLKRVTATELFNAMNLMFETENSLWRWQLLMNGSRPTAVFRVLPDVLFGTQSPPPPEAPKKERKIFFMGDLLDDQKTNGLTEGQLMDTLLQVWQGAINPSKPYEFNKLLQFHRESQLFVVTGTPDEVQLIEDTLAALKQKVLWQAERKPLSTSSGGGGAKTKSEATKTP
jgi:hypothetical protein